MNGYLLTPAGSIPSRLSQSPNFSTTKRPLMAAFSASKPVLCDV